MRLFGRPIRTFHLVVVAIITAILFAFLGPFNTFMNMSLAKRLGFWLTLIAMCGLFFHVSVMFTLHYQRIAHWSRLMRLLTGSFVASFPGLLVFLLTDYLFRGRVYSSSNLLFLWTTVFVIGTCISYANFMPPFIKLSEEEKEAEEDPELIPFLKRLSDDLGYKLVSMSMKDHYIHVTTSNGNELIHVTFADAMRELRLYPGMQIHRSHWVAKDAITRLVRQGRSDFVELNDGRKLPVSNSYYANLVEIMEMRQAAEYILAKPPGAYPAHAGGLIRLMTRGWGSKTPPHSLKQR